MNNTYIISTYIQNSICIYLTNWCSIKYVFVKTSQEELPNVDKYIFVYKFNYNSIILLYHVS